MTLRVQKAGGSTGRVADAKQLKNRLRLDFRPDDQPAEVERFIALGACPADVGQGEQP